MRLFRYLAFGLLCLSPSFATLAQTSTPAVPIDAATRKAVIDVLGEKLKAKYIFPEVADKVTAVLSAREKSGAYDNDKTANSFAKALTQDLRNTGKDLHFGVHYDAAFKEDEDPEDDSPPSKAELDDMRKFAEDWGFGIAKIERLPGNVGYLDLRGFPPADFTAGAYAAAINVLSGTDALIVDLRLNGGGDPGAVANFLSHFFAAGDNRHLNDLFWRAGNRTQEFWTMPVSGPRYANPVYVLTSARTFSGGEECAYDFQTQKRAVLIGQPTGGGANPGGTFSLSHGFVAFIPVGRAINAITKTNWEHVGVKPDVIVPAADAMKTAYVTILQSLIAHTKDHDALNELKDALAKAQKGDEEKPDYSPRHH